MQKLLIAYDRDEAGERTASKLAPELAAAGMAVFRVVFPRHMDVNEYALKVQPAHKSLGTAVRSAQWLAGSRAVSVPVELPVSSEHVGPASAEDGADDRGGGARRSARGARSNFECRTAPGAGADFLVSR